MSMASAQTYNRKGKKGWEIEKVQNQKRWQRCSVIVSGRWIGQKDHERLLANG